MAQAYSRLGYRFQSASPMQGATRVAWPSGCLGKYFNPHPPCEGDLKSIPKGHFIVIFQSAPPVRRPP